VEIFPISLKLQQQRCLIVGGGHIAYRKANLLVKAGAIIDVIAPEIEPDLQQLVEKSLGQYIQAPFSVNILATPYRLVIAATDQPDVNKAVFEQCEIRNLLVNSVDDIPNCRFMVPAIIDRSPLVISVASNGASPVLSRQIRTQLESSIPHGMGKLAEFSGQWRKQVKEKLPIQMSVVFFGKTYMQAH
jgi:uroporphyrin-III C-methyltransferase/precorrin-2 dehydrogenase/sirohydrochlorin ferrochelatase